MKLNALSRSCMRVNRDEEQIARCKAILSGLTTDFGRLSRVVHLAGNEVRMKILLLLHKEQSLCVCDLSDILEMTIPAVSQHLRKLKDARILEPRREGTVIHYSITSEYEEIVRVLLHLVSKAEMKKAV